MIEVLLLILLIALLVILVLRLGGTDRNLVVFALATVIAIVLVGRLL